MGVASSPEGLVETYLDAVMLVDSLVRHLSGVDATSARAGCIGRELVKI
jgi:hypothetical protein